MENTGVKIKEIRPHIPSDDVDFTKEFFINIFAFDVLIDRENFVQLIKNDLKIDIVKSHGIPNGQSIYIELDEIEQLWDNVKEPLSRFKPKELFEQEYGMKEFHVVAPGTKTLLFFGEPINA